MTDRRTRVQEALSAEGFGALLLASPANMAYVCGFRPTPLKRFIALVVPREGPLRLVAPSLEEEAARSATPDGTELFVWRDEEGPREALARALEGVSRRVGFEKAYLTVAYHELSAACAPGARFDGCDELLARLRAVKDEQELERLRRAARIVDRTV